MLVYGDHCESADAGERLTSIAQQLAALAKMPRGIDRHARLVRALIESGQLLQGVADRGDATGELDLFLHRLAVAVVRSADTRFSEIGELPPIPSLRWAGQVELRLPEGFAFYAVYPESYVAAARQLRLSAPPRVIGIRSIGTTLGAIVAATLGAPPALTVRPFGHPFAREVDLATVERDVHYVIVDEGPGLSGSSFGSVADVLEARGVPLERIAFVPSHAGDLGPEASERHRARWRGAQRVPAEFDPEFLRERFGALQPFSMGHPWERLKFRAMRDGEPVLLKFAGLGASGERKLEMARALHAAGLTPEPLGLVHGFLVERWQQDAEPLQKTEKPVEAIGRYIGTRAGLFPADAESGASIDELLTMCRRNVGLAFGDEVARRLDQWNPDALAARVLRIRTDNKLDRCEWLRLADGRLLKTDAVDHHQAHDLVGCQDVAWDVAGAITEFELCEGEERQLLAAACCAADAELLAFYRVAYAAFRLGQATLCGTDEGRYRQSLRLLLQDHTTCDSAGILV